MLARSPVTRLSITTTRCPSAIRRSAMWLPMKPAPPVISIRIFLPICEDRATERQRDRETEGRGDGETEDEMQPLSVPLSLPLSVSLSLSPSVSLSSSPDSSIFKSRLFDRLWVQQVAPVNERLRVHNFAYLIEVQVAELFPLGDDDYGVAIFSERYSAGGVLNLEFGVLAAADVIGDRVVSLHARAHLDQFRRDLYRGGVSQVVLTRFEGH